MQIGEIMTKNVGFCRADDTLDVAARIMWSRDCGSVPVVLAGRPIAMLTDRDICMAAYTQGRPLSQIQVASAMSRELHACRSSDPLAVARRRLAAHQIRRLAIVGPDGMLAGILSLGDLARAALAIDGSNLHGPSGEATEAALLAICRPRPAATAHHSRGGL